MVLDAYAQALQSFGDMGFLLSIAGGVAIGLVFGIIPGLGGTVAVALLLPFMFTLPPDRGLPLLLSIMSVQFIGGSITAILLNIPGTGPNAATLIDGFPMAQKGEAARAMGAALTACGVGSLLTSFLALVSVPIVLFIIMSIHSAELVFIILMGLAFIAVIDAGSRYKGVISGGAGLLIGFIGFQSTTGVSRFTFGNLYLYDGIPLIALAMGLFALPEMITLAAEQGTVAKTRAVQRGFHGLLEGMKDVFRHWGLCLRSSIIGYVCGLIPGVGAETATFIAYGHAKQTSKNPEKFGTGIVEGVIAPESANDAKEGGALLTTLALGIPGSTVYALVLGGMLMMGLTPGPSMIQEHLPLSLSLMLVIAVASVVGVGICLLLAPQMAKIVFIPAPILVPIVVVFIFIGTYAERGYFNDLIVLLIISGVGLGMKKFNYSAPAMFLGYALGAHFETYFFKALGVGGPFFFMRPISLLIIFIILGVFGGDSIKKLFRYGFKRGTKPK